MRGLLASLGRSTLREPGACLLVLAHCRRRGIERGPAVLATLAASLQVPVAALRRVDGFLDRVLDRSGTPGQLTLCRGTSCTLHGAAELHPKVLAALQAAGMDREVTEVFCLSQCEHGPSIMVGRQIFCGVAQDVVEDRRSWRPEDAGPVPLTDRSRPVLD